MSGCDADHYDKLYTRRLTDTCMDTLNMRSRAQLWPVTAQKYEGGREERRKGCRGGKGQGQRKRRLDGGKERGR